MIRPERDRAVGSGGTARVTSLGIGLLGVVLVVGGTFLPWLNSGAVSRNLYAVAGAAQRLGLLGPGSISGWLPLLGPVCAVPVLLAALRWYRSAAVLGALVALACGGAATAALVMVGGRSALGVSLAVAGPVTTLVGALILAAGSAAVLVTASRARSGTPGRGHPTDGPHRIDENRSAIAPDLPH